MLHYSVCQSEHSYIIWPTMRDANFGKTVASPLERTLLEDNNLFIELNYRAWFSGTKKRCKASSLVKCPFHLFTLLTRKDLLSSAIL